MRRQRYVYTLPSQDDSTILNESDSASILSSPYSYSETVWSQIISPEPEPLVPFCIYQYPFYQLPAEQFPIYSTSFTSPITNTSLQSLESVSPYNDEYTKMTPPIYNASYSDEFYPSDCSYEGSLLYENVESIQDIQHACPSVTNYGAVTILLRHLVRVDISPNKSVYVTNPPSSCIAAINGAGDKSCAIHPNGRIFHDGPEIHMTTLNRKAKVSKRGIVFTSSDHCLSYLVDASGTKTTAEKFRDMKHDFSLEVFYNYSMSPEELDICYNMVNEAEYKSYWNGDEVWLIGEYRIKQDIRGDVKITRNAGKQFIRSSPTTGQVLVKTSQTEFSVGRYAHNYFFVRKGDKQVSASIKGFNVQNGTQKAGFNKFGRLVLF